ncbi:DUF2087 domain-containing protein [Brevibacillus dissolubilis]|uniref:DUF2087 domain-containing protein n=1 Tax=Brevibacillus dissolubilis TaxID=1844116 RepID=UPI001117A7D6|nr:DUF2087 domain-containing protein [Brevibacillus dissolubilis]
MQIDQLVQFHKAVGDVNRIRILTMLARQPMSGIELAERLGITPATITHHTQKLKKLGFVYEVRDKNTLILHLIPQEFKRYATAIIDTVLPPDLSVPEKWEFIREHPDQNTQEQTQTASPEETKHPDHTKAAEAADPAKLKPAQEESAMSSATNDVEKQRVLASFFTPEGKLKSIPTQLKKRIFILEKLAEGLDIGRSYSEKEISDYLKAYHDDFATLRRELIMNHIMYRADGIYTLNPRELWNRID